MPAFFSLVVNGSARLRSPLRNPRRVPGSIQFMPPALPICAGRRYTRRAIGSRTRSGDRQNQLQRGKIDVATATPADHPDAQGPAGSARQSVRSQETRAGFEQMAALFPVDADVKCEPVNAGGVKAEWVTAPGADAGRAMLYLHGGGYVIGSINTHRDPGGAHFARGRSARAADRLPPRARASVSRGGRGFRCGVSLDARARD